MAKAKKEMAKDKKEVKRIVIVLTPKQNEILEKVAESKLRSRTKQAQYIINNALMRYTIGDD